MKVLKPYSPEKLARAEELLRNPRPGSKMAAAKEYGIDLTLLIEKLRLTPAERVERMMNACIAAEELRGAAHRKQP
jgi:hypothetical protein